MKVILHPTDFSENSRQAFQTAVKIAGLAGAKLIVAHVFDIPTLAERPYITAYHNQVEKEIAKSKREITKWAERLLPEGANIQLECEALNNPFTTQALTALAIEKSADMLVIGTMGNSKFKEILLGSTALQLMQESPYPVLAVPPAGFAHSPQKMAYATDFHPQDVAALNQLKEIAILFDATIDVIHVPDVTQKITDYPQDYVSIIKKEVEYDKLRFVTLEPGNVYQRLLEYTEAHKTGVLGMLEKGRGIFSRLIKQDRVIQVGGSSPVPIISFNAKFLM